MNAKIIVICGSPRPRGNTNTVVKWFVEEAKSLKAEVEVVDAAKLQYKANGCTACMSCQKSKKFECVIEDEASKVIARIPQFDAMGLATPVYWLGPSAQLKLLLDRTFALVKFDPKTGEMLSPPDSRRKVMGLIATAGGGPEEGLELLDATFRAAAKMEDIRYESLLVPFAPVNPREMAKKENVRKQAIRLARRIVRG